MTTLLIVIFIFILALVMWALLGKGEDTEKTPEKKPEEAALRRRAADKIIEEQFPDAEGRLLYRRKEDIEAFEEVRKVDDDFRLPYSANDIIPEGSKHWVYNRTLVNSEIYARKGDFPTAISLYRGVYERVIDQGVNTKIKANVDYLQEYQKVHLHRKSEAIRQKAIEKKGSEIRLSLDGPLTIPDKIQIALSQPMQDIASKFDINKIVDDIAEKIAAKRKEEESKKEEEAKKEESELEELKAKTEELSKLKEGLLKLNEKMLNMAEDGLDAKKDLEEMKSQLQSAIEEAEKEPKPTEALFREENKPEPEIEVPEPKKIDFPKETELQKEIHKEVDEEKDEDEEIEVMSQFDKEEEFSGLSDEDIFEKILKDDLSKKKDDSFEIVGYSRDKELNPDDYMDKELEAKQKEEEQFYRKFLRHGRRVRKELPILKVSYDFSKLPDEFSLSKDQNMLQYSFYKFKPMLEKANELIKRRNVRDAINYYNVVKEQNIPPEFKVMLNKNISELTEYIEKYLTAE